MTKHKRFRGRITKDLRFDATVASLSRGKVQWRDSSLTVGTANEMREWIINQINEDIRVMETGESYKIVVVMP